MQNGKSATQQDRVTNRGMTKATRNVEEKRKKITENVRHKQEAKEVKTSTIHDADNKGTDVETKRKLQTPTVNRNKAKVISYSKADDGLVSYSIQKLLSVYQNAKTEKSPDRRRPQAVENRKPRVYTRPSGNNVSRIPEIQGGLKNGSAGTDKVLNRRISPVQRVQSEVKDVQHKKAEEVQTRKTLQKPKTSPVISKTELPEKIVETKAPDTEATDTEAPEKEAEPCNEIIPLLTPDRSTHSPLSQIHSFIANYLEEETEDDCKSKSKLEFFMPENSVNAFPVCSKTATDNIPSSDIVRPEVAPSTRELIIMLRRRNSEPYSPKSCILQYSSREEDHPLSPAVSDAWGFGCENYYFWEQGPIRPSKPYWEVSLFKSNKSSSVLNSSAGLLSLTPPKHTGEILINGDFGPRYRERCVKSWSPDLHSCKSLVRTVPFVNSMETLPTLPPAQVKTATKQEPRPPGISKDDHYKHPAHLLIYVKSSQKKLVSLDSGANRGGDFANKKVHKIKKILGGTLETRGASSKNVMFSTLTVVFLLTGGLAFFVYFLARLPTLSSLTPLIPGLLRRC